MAPNQPPILDGTNSKSGFYQDIVTHALSDASQQRVDGNWVLGFTEAIGSVPANTAARDWEVQNNIQGMAYVDDSHGSPVTNSQNGRVDVSFGKMAHVQQGG